MKLFHLYESTSDQTSWEDDPVFIFNELVSIYKSKRQNDEEVAPKVRQLEAKLIEIATSTVNASMASLELFAYATHVKMKRWKTIEPILLSLSTKHATNYAGFVLKRRWPKLEHVLVTSGTEHQIKNYVYEMKAKKIVDAHEATALQNNLLYQLKLNTADAKKSNVQESHQTVPQIPPFRIERKLEPFMTLITDPLEAANAGIKHLHLDNTRYLPLEDVILRDPAAIVRYVVHGLHTRWKTAEPIIAQDAEAANLYAKKIVKGRFKLGEAAIAKDPYLSLSYAKTIGGRFPAGEEQMDEDVFIRYKKFLRGLESK